jgi:SAM-dependent methyltransferase
VGITLVESQAHLAQGFMATGQAGGIPAARVTPSPGNPASKNSTARFVVNDFNVPAFKEKSFDVVWAVESFDHAQDKESWIKAMFALLKPGGRLIIADGFRGSAPVSKSQASQYRGFLAGWAVPHLCSFQELSEYCVRAGFKTRHGEDISRDVLPHARAIFRFGLLFIPIRWLLEKVGLTSAEKLGNAYATFFQYRTLKQGLWNYGVFCFQKPD